MANDSKGVWQQLETNTNYKTKRNMIQVQNPHEFANEINNIYTRFDFHEKNLIEDEENSITISVEGKLSSRKATGPDNISNKVLNICCDQLAEPLYRLVQLSFEKHSIPSAWKTSCIIPVPKA